jgi:tetratricopeptide (TPR) repeat protein
MLDIMGDEMEIENLRLRGLSEVREGRIEDAIVLYDEALALAEDETLRELITINKADALIALERSGPEVLELARVIMRRRNARHVYLAAYALQYKHRIEANLKRALFYGELALRTADEANEPLWRRIVLLELGNIYEIDSQIDRAIACYEEALAIFGESDSVPEDQHLAHAYALENLGYCRLMQGNVDDGIATILEALTRLHDPVGLAEAYVDLCYGYLEKRDLDNAHYYGNAALGVAKDGRQIRNAHYLLGEVAYTAGDTATAEHHFEALSRFYPDFTNLKSLLFAIDLRSMVNLKL